MALKVKCKECGNDFLVISKELDFYKEKDFPLPNLCPEHRLARRNAMRNKKELLGYKCDNCGKDIVIAFDPPEEQKVFCKACHQQYMENNDCILGYSEGAKAENPQRGKSSNAADPAANPSVATVPTGGEEVRDPVGL